MFGVAAAVRSRCFGWTTWALVGLMCGGSVWAQSAVAAAMNGSDSTVTGQLHGAVVNAGTGLPVPRALVRFDGLAMLTDHDGRFSFDQVSADDGAIQVLKPGFYLSTEPFDNSGQFVKVSQLASGLRLRLYPESLLTGTMTAPGGDPLPGIPVSAMRIVFDEDGARWMPEGQAITDSHGNFRIPVPAGGYRLTTRYMPPRPNDGFQAVLPVVLPGGNASDTFDMIRIRSGEEQHFDVRPAMGRVHSVRVRFESGEERGFSRIRVRADSGAEFSLNAAPTGESGVYRMELPNGSYGLSASSNGPAGLVEAETRVTVADGDVTGVVLRFSPVPELPVEMSIDSGATSDKSQPKLTQLGLMLQDEQADSERGGSRVRLSSGPDHSVAFSAMAGTYRLQAANEGEWYVKAASYGDTDLLQQALTVVPGAGGAPVRVVVSNRTGALQVSVRQSGEPASCWVYLIPSMPSARTAYSLRSNSDGTVTFAYLPPGTYQAVAFERRHSADYSQAAALAAYSTQVRTVAVRADDRATLELDAVPEAEIVP